MASLLLILRLSTLFETRGKIYTLLINKTYELPQFLLFYSHKRNK